MIKQMPIIICDQCAKEVDTNNYVKISVPNDYECSHIEYNKNNYEVADKDYCSIECLTAHITYSLMGT